MEKNERIIIALDEINKIIEGVKDIIPTGIKKIEKNKEQKPWDPEKILWKISRIIMNYNEENAERKLSSVMGFLKKINLYKK